MTIALFALLSIAMAASPALTPMLAIGLPLVITVIGGWLSHTKFNPWVNDGIVLAVFFGCVAAAVFGAMSAGQLTGNAVIDFSVLGAYAAVVMQLPAMKALLAAFTLKVPSPFGVFASAPKDPGAGGGGPMPTTGGMTSAASVGGKVSPLALPYGSQRPFPRPTTLYKFPDTQGIDAQATMPTGIVDVIHNSEAALQKQREQGMSDVGGG